VQQRLRGFRLLFMNMAVRVKNSVPYGSLPTNGII